jgi:hypothetical protein
MKNCAFSFNGIGPRVMYVLAGLFQATLASFTLPESTVLAPTKAPAHTHSMLDESYLTVYSIEPSTEITPPLSHASVSTYRKWLGLIFGDRGGSPSEAPFNMRTIQDGWVVIDQITRKDTVFEQIWDPTVSGDWSMLNVETTGAPAFSAEGDKEAWEDQWDASSHASLLKWAFKTDDTDSMQRDLDRLKIWKRSASSLYKEQGLSYIDYLMMDIPEKVTEAIAVDVERTNPPELQIRMRRILHAFAARNATIGFCQGMSYIVSSLLQNEWMSDEDAFVFFTALIEGVNVDYYDDGLSGLHGDLRRMEKFMFYKLGHTLAVPIELVLVEPMMCLFTRLLPLETALRMIDIALTHGRVGLFSIYLALVELLKSDLEAAVTGADSPSMAIVEGAVAFKVAMIKLLTEDCNRLLRRAEGFLLTYRSELEKLIAEDVSVERENRELELVLSTSTFEPTSLSHITGTPPPASSSQIAGIFPQALNQMRSPSPPTLSTQRRGKFDFLNRVASRLASALLDDDPDD